jgi:hypothetical protein
MNSAWTKEQCRLRYVQGERIGLKALAVESGVPIGTLKRWSSEKPETWPQQRRQFDTKVRLLTHQKSVEAVSGAITQSNEAVIAEHLEMLAMLREIASFFFKAVLFKVKEIENDSDPDSVNDKLLEFLKTLGGRVPLQTYSNVLHIAIQGERQALHLDLVDPAILERAANRHGLSLVNLEVVENPNA